MPFHLPVSCSLSMSMSRRRSVEAARLDSLAVTASLSPATWQQLVRCNNILLLLLWNVRFWPVRR